MLDEANHQLHPVSDLFQGFINITKGCRKAKEQKEE